MRSTTLIAVTAALALSGCNGSEIPEANTTNMVELEAADPAMDDATKDVTAVDGAAMDANMMAGDNMTMSMEAPDDLVDTAGDSLDPSTAGNPNPPLGQEEQPPPQPRDREYRGSLPQARLGPELVLGLVDGDDQRVEFGRARGQREQATKAGAEHVEIALREQPDRYESFTLCHRSSPFSL